MAEAADRRVALLSIHPAYADAILRGDKRVEFRRRGPARTTAHVIVYATAPISKVVGWFSVEAVDSDVPMALWRRYGSVGGITRDRFEAYYAACQTGDAIRIGTAELLESPIALKEIDPDLYPPQSFRYVTRAVLEMLITQPTTALA